MNKTNQSDVLSSLVNDANQPHLKIKKLSEDAILPTRGTADSAGLDLYALEDVIIDPQSNKPIHTGIAMSIPKGYVGLLFARSGLATKQLLRPSNCVGVIDSDYRGEVILNLYNDNTNVEERFVQISSDPNVGRNVIVSSKENSKQIKKGDRVAQLVLVPYIAPNTIECNQLDKTDRGEGGFGSTGK